MGRPKTSPELDRALEFLMGREPTTPSNPTAPKVAIMDECWAVYRNDGTGIFEFAWPTEEQSRQSASYCSYPVTVKRMYLAASPQPSDERVPSIEETREAISNHKFDTSEYVHLDPLESVRSRDSAIRAEAMEEAAKVCEGYHSFSSAPLSNREYLAEAANAIRSLAQPKPECTGIPHPDAEG